MSKTAKQAQASALSKIMQAAAELTAEERLEVARAGVVVPHAADGDDPLQQVFGYRCKHCGGLALVFLGSRFIDGQGNEVESPPCDVPITMLPWIQDGDVTQINRHAPKCQQPSCRQVINLQGGKYLLDKLIIRIERWQQSRALKVTRRRSRQLSGLVTPTGELLTETWPGAKTRLGDHMSESVKERINDIAQQHGLDDIKVS